MTVGVLRRPFDRLRAGWKLEGRGQQSAGQARSTCSSITRARVWRARSAAGCSPSARGLERRPFSARCPGLALLIALKLARVPPPAHLIALLKRRRLAHGMATTRAHHRGSQARRGFDDRGSDDPRAPGAISAWCAADGRRGSAPRCNPAIRSASSGAPGSTSIWARTRSSLFRFAHGEVDGQWDGAGRNQLSRRAGAGPARARSARGGPCEGRRPSSLTRLTTARLRRHSIARFEAQILAECGFRLDLGSCAGDRRDRRRLVYVSPKSGRAVSAEAGSSVAAIACCR